MPSFDFSLSFSLETNSRIQLSPFFLPLHVSITRNNRLNVANFSKNYLSQIDVAQPPFGRRSPSISALSLSRVGEGMARNRKRRFDSAGTELVYKDFRFWTSTRARCAITRVFMRSLSFGSHSAIINIHPAWIWIGFVSLHKHPRSKDYENMRGGREEKRRRSRGEVEFYS